MPELYCPQHGPYDAQLGSCPFCLSPQKNQSWVEDIPTAATSRSRQVDFLHDETNIPSNPSMNKFRTEKKSIGIRVFVSSTYEDLKDYREVVFKAIHSMFGYADDMLFWSADERDALTVSLERVKQCDLVILLLAHRYGYIPTGQKYSVTELEYRTAIENGIPVLAFIVDENIPWQKSYIEFEKQEELNKFKKLVEEASVRGKKFGSIQDLHVSVTQALHHFIERYHQKSIEERRFRTTLLVKSRSDFITFPDMITQIGNSEDGFPLLLSVKRSKNLGKYFNEIANGIESTYDDDSIDDILDNFRDQLERRAAKAWAYNRLFPVVLKNGKTETMYITSKNLSELTSSLFHKILEKEYTGFSQADQRSKYDDDENVTQLPAPRSSSSDTDSNPSIESFGGMNRFLGVSIESEQVYSVGKGSEEWVEWHPFFHESISKNFPSCRFCINPYSSEGLDFKSFKDKMDFFFFENMDDRGFLNTNITLTISRQSIGQIIAKVAEVVANTHNRGIVHGDIKPKNILLTSSGPMLIDSLNLKPGNLSHGWTPKWTAPEQVVQTPVSFTTDIYPLGLLVLNLLGGKLIGEVRKFIVPTINNPEREHNVFFNPSIFLGESEIIRNGKKEWMKFIESCLKFDNTLRPKSASEFVGNLTNLLYKFPLVGDVNVDLNNGDMVAVTLLDGTKKVAKMLVDSSI